LDVLHGKFKKWLYATSDAQKVVDFLEMKNIASDPDKSLPALVDDRFDGASGPGGNKPDAHDKAILTELYRHITSTQTVRSNNDLDNEHMFTSPLTIPPSVILTNKFYPERGKIMGQTEKEKIMKEKFRSSFGDSIPTQAISGLKDNETTIFFAKKFNDTLLDNIFDNANNVKI
jgi:hypothetical protein